MHAAAPDSRRLLEQLIREVLRAEAQAIDHQVREAKRIGIVTPPVLALREVSTHATAMGARLVDVLQHNEITVHKRSLGTTLATLRHLVVDRVVDAERSFRSVLLELRSSIDVVTLLRELARRIELFGVIRWCDDWLGARRTLVVRVEAQLGWFAEQETLASGTRPRVVELPTPTLDVEPIEDTIPN